MCVVSEPLCLTNGPVKENRVWPRQTKGFVYQNDNRNLCSQGRRPQYSQDRVGLRVTGHREWKQTVPLPNPLSWYSGRCCPLWPILATVTTRIHEYGPRDNHTHSLV